MIKFAESFLKFPGTLSKTYQWMAFLLLFGVLLLSCTPTPDLKMVKFNGETQGTYYVVTYYDKEGRNLQNEIDLLLANFDTIASMWVAESQISKINRNEDVLLDSSFIELFNISNRIYAKTKGAFDPTVGPLVNAWGFGFTDRMHVDQHLIDSLLPLVGLNQVKIENKHIVKADNRIQIDFNAIAQGYSVDLVDNFLSSKGIDNFLIDIGGEVKASGQKPGHETWKVGIEKPADNAGYGENLNAIIKLSNKSLATSGNYRKFYEEDGVRYSHTINPKTGYPVQHAILSVSVLAKDCAVADAYATSFMVMGFDNSIEILASDTTLDAYFIYGGTSDTLHTYFTEGFKKIILEEIQ